MSPSSTASSAAANAAPLPPLGDLASSPGAASDPQQGGFMAALMAGIKPIKSDVDLIQQACQRIVQSGSIPGGEQIVGQIIGLANQLMPMAIQQMAQGQGGQGAQGAAAPGGIAPPPQGGAPPMPPVGQ